ncbi:MAG: arsenite methyltransferase, partial [Deltaproteobacteria bacterium]|nr:arsenite methyltransferase [Deltaproteobacteria bacterium]
IRITPKTESRELIRQWDPDSDDAIADYVVSAYIEAVKPG